MKCPIFVFWIVVMETVLWCSLTTASPEAVQEVAAQNGTLKAIQAPAAVKPSQQAVKVVADTKPSQQQQSATPPGVTSRNSMEHENLHIAFGDHQYEQDEREKETKRRDDDLPLRCNMTMEWSVLQAQKNLLTDLHVCILACSGLPKKSAQCLVQKAPVSPACSLCFADVAACGAVRCVSGCALGVSNCFSCLSDHCESSLAKCTGPESSHLHKQWAGILHVRSTELLLCAIFLIFVVLLFVVPSMTPEKNGHRDHKMRTLLD
eukprot:gnl/Hemi2/20943_TR6940_c0_g1_i1.p1 gnl/Hemi2/20943_TR6940_c0_g1~~gnl/Hemi2/20943_TR6940_c0_g1_i1.p1  ORF type:complete len:263 (+),score=57.00 gnl/Hemi2/20943_TR6940_c0_g1_i1:273-1061(+)